jgi:Ca2+-binding EF-hand superfamily protein
MQFANADSIAGVYMPICRAEPAFAVYFLVLWLVVTVAVMNLVTAIIVENALAHGREDTEENQRQLRKVVKRIVPEIEEVFDKLDTDGSESLTFEEIEAATHNGELTLPDDIREIVEPHRLLEIFEFLDMDQSGTIEKDEFVDGVGSLAVSAVPIETTQILKLMRRTHHSVMEIEKIMQQTSTKSPGGASEPSPFC